MDSNFDALQKNLRVEVRLHCSSCSYPVQATANDTLVLKDEEVDKRSSIGRLHLGDTEDQVNKILGSVFKKELFAEHGHFPEPWNKRTYDQGIIPIIGKNTGKVLEL